MKLSIITINYNNLAGLQKTMESVFAQTCKDFEYIVIDGASTDGSAEYIRAHADQLTYWVSEKDSGIYNAMNKGVRVAKGEYLLMLNSGDFLVDDRVIERILPELDGTDIVQGNTIEGQKRNRGYGKSDITFLDVMGGNFLHQASFIKKSLHAQYGLYDETYKKSSDTYFYWKVLGFGNATFRYVDVDVANFDTHGISFDPKWAAIDKQEDARWYKENFPIRLQKLYKEAPKRFQLYDSLHRYKWIWYLTMGLAKISNMATSQRSNPPEKSDNLAKAKKK